MVHGTIADIIVEWCRVETWRPIAGWPYEVSSWGRVRGPRGQILVPAVAHGYQYVSLSRGILRRTARVHKLVLAAFVGPSPIPDGVAAHNDGDKANNRLDNLRWATGVDNQQDRRRHATKWVGSAVQHAKLVEDDIPIIRRRARNESYATIASDYGVSISTISLIKRGITWSHVQEGPTDVQ